MVNNKYKFSKLPIIACLFCATLLNALDNNSINYNK